jgi:hypothetical protein
MLFQYFAKITGFFIVEEAISKSNQSLLDTSATETMWKQTLSRMQGGIASLIAVGILYSLICLCFAWVCIFELLSTLNACFLKLSRHNFGYLIITQHIVSS